MGQEWEMNVIRYITGNYILTDTLSPYNNKPNCQITKASECLSNRHLNTAGRLPETNHRLK